MRNRCSVLSVVFSMISVLSAPVFVGCAAEVGDLESTSDAACVGASVGDRLNPGARIESCEGPSTQLVMQHDGNLVLYGSGGPIWHTHTYGHPGAFAVLEDEGLVVYAPDGHTRLAIAHAESYATYMYVGRNVLELVAGSTGLYAQFPGGFLERIH